MNLWRAVREDIDAIMVRDPAACSRLTVLFAYPGIHSVLIHRLANLFHRNGLCFLARMVSHVGRFLTSIEIHPGAELGRRLFIDHGVGCVIGETTVIGDDVTLYQGVTLGGVTLDVGKRHPTLEDGVIVGAGAKVLGPFIVGTGARIAANAVVLKEVPSGVTVAGVPARPMQGRSSGADFRAYGTPGADVPDPVARALDTLTDELSTLRKRLDELEHE